MCLNLLLLFSSVAYGDSTLTCGVVMHCTCYSTSQENRAGNGLRAGNEHCHSVVFSSFLGKRLFVIISRTRKLVPCMCSNGFVVTLISYRGNMGNTDFVQCLLTWFILNGIVRQKRCISTSVDNIAISSED